MGSLALTVYVLAWPILVAGVLFFLVRGFLKDWREAHREGRTII